MLPLCYRVFKCLRNVHCRWMMFFEGIFPFAMDTIDESEKHWEDYLSRRRSITLNSLISTVDFRLFPTKFKWIQTTVGSLPYSAMSLLFWWNSFAFVVDVFHFDGGIIIAQLGVNKHKWYWWLWEWEKGKYYSGLITHRAHVVGGKHCRWNIETRRSKQTKSIPFTIGAERRYCNKSNLLLILLTINHFC